ncbi:MAG: HNH endonuclease [Bdellovibrionales bacterium]|nr:HNH endonuclease [Bdellovibrionales bacterium]
MDFYAPQDPQFIKKQREKARELRASRWWKEKLSQGICYYCETRFPPAELTMDHKVPIARGGVSSRENIVVCCKECNSKKGSQTSVDLVVSNINEFDIKD